MTKKTNYKPTNQYIEKEANDIIKRRLRALFFKKNLELIENTTNPSQDYGTDYYMEVLNKDNNNKREMLFLLQCKGINKNPKILKNEQSFSFQISLRHASYFYYELTEPLMFIVCDITEEKVYWYAVQLDAQIKNKIIDQVKLKKKTLQVKIPSENTLDEANFDRFLLELKDSQLAQIHKKKESLNLKANYEKINNKIKDLNIVEGFQFFLDTFKGINVFPEFVINKLHIFTGKDGSLYGETLSTKNDKLYDFISNLELHNGKYILKNNNVDYSRVADFQDTVRHILTFFRVNCITHLTWFGNSDKKRKRICIHDLYVSKVCSCERCSYAKLNFPRVNKLLASETDSNEIENRLKRAYTYYLISDFEKSYLEYKKVIADVNMSKTPGHFIIAKYNLLQLKNLMYWQFFDSNRNEILKELEYETFVLDEILIPEFYLDIFKQIAENKFFNNMLWEIDKKLNEIQKLWRIDQFGGSSTNNHARSLIIDFLRIYNFIEFNLIIYKEYREFKVIVTKLLEGIFALYSINNPESSRYNHFGSTIIDMWLFHAESSQIKYLILKYDLKTLNMEFSTKEFERLNEYIGNLINCSHLIIQNHKANNYTYIDKIKQIMQNYMLIISIINLSNYQKNILLEKTLLFFESIGDLHLTMFEFINDFITLYSEVNIQNLEKIICILNKHEQYQIELFPNVVSLYMKNFSTPHETELAIKRTLEIDEFNIEDFDSNGRYSELVFVIPSLTLDTIKSMKAQTIAVLNKNFNSELFYMMSIYNVLDYDKLLLDKFFSLTPDYTEKQTGYEFLSGKKERRNYHLDKAINLAFHYEVEFTSEYRNLSSRAIDKDYYNWLMNIEGFDYSKFNLYWILNYKTKSYFKIFKKSKKLNLEISKNLKNNYIEGVAKILIHDFEL